MTIHKLLVSALAIRPGAALELAGAQPEPSRSPHTDTNRHVLTSTGIMFEELAHSCIIAGFALLIAPLVTAQKFGGLRQQPCGRKTTGSMLMLNKCGPIQGLIFRRGTECSFTGRPSLWRPVTYEKAHLPLPSGPQAGGRESDVEVPVIGSSHLYRGVNG